MLSQKCPIDNQWHPVAFYSKALKEAKTYYEIYNKELYAVILGLKEWQTELISLASFLIIIDHKALEYFETKKLLNK